MASLPVDVALNLEVLADEVPQATIVQGDFRIDTDPAGGSEDDTDSDFVFSDDDEEPPKSAQRSKPQKEQEHHSDDEGEGDDGGKEGTAKGRGLRTKNELDLPPPEDVENMVAPDGTEFLCVGSIMALVEDQVVVESVLDGENKVLDAETVLFLEDKRALGRVFETFGPVARPLYSIRVDLSKENAKNRYRIGAEVFYVPTLANFVFTAQIKAIKGSDASNEYDEEVAENVGARTFATS
ncbi:hypothetical protein HDU96_006210 [Phlyctochytrium bullatum]|nr:hypothetical protein HDU96_006210 [Phlyctochytrium bullatum]